MIKQIVLLKTREGVTQAQIDDANKKTDQLFATLKEPQLVERGPNIAAFGMDKGFSLCCIITMESKEDLGSFMANSDRQQLTNDVW